jgi:hypothetical protein
MKHKSFYIEIVTHKLQTVDILNPPDIIQDCGH